jgi:hypothetical protein
MNNRSIWAVVEWLVCWSCEQAVGYCGVDGCGSPFYEDSGGVDERRRGDGEVIHDQGRSSLD